MKQYELTLIFKSDLEQEKIDADIDAFKLQVVQRQVWGKRLLAYPINKQKEGLYMHLVIELKEKDVAKVNQEVTLNENVIRHLFVASEKDIEK